MHPWRCDQIEILCIGEKRKHFAAWLRQPKLRLEIPHTHGTTPVSVTLKL